MQPTQSRWLLYPQTLCRTPRKVCKESKQQTVNIDHPTKSVLRSFDNRRGKNIPGPMKAISKSFHTENNPEIDYISCLMCLAVRGGRKSGNSVSSAFRVSMKISLWNLGQAKKSSQFRDCRALLERKCQSWPDKWSPLVLLLKKMRKKFFINIKVLMFCFD